MTGKLNIRVPNNDYNILKRRYLNRARISFSDINILQEFVDSFKHRNTYDPSSFSLRNTISNLFYLTKKLSFRQNATQIFRDVLEGLVFHYSDSGIKTEHKLFATDIDHPVMTDMAEIILTKSNVFICQISNKIIWNSSLEQNLITNYFVEEVIKSKSTIVLIPHVNWINGAKLDVLSICKQIKDVNPEIITIVDGAQALGNVETKIDGRFCNLNIDFYIGCGQKWMGSPIPIGFARVSEKFIEKKQFSKFIFTCDYFSEFAGNQDFLDQPALDTYNIHFSLLFDTVIKKFQDNKGQIKSYYYHDIINNRNILSEIINRSKKLELFDLPEDMKSGIVSLTGNEMTLSRLSDKLNELKFLHTFDELKTKKGKMDFIRLSSPNDSFSSDDLNDFESVIVSLK